uniref:non-specific serine/threonine protein kinase n=1 Tax=Thermosporothrix sp. COM3 TaxID=2490863 RepID=A0A455SE45_9CHLR|nr:hypothetical protein KTC_03690 [Thermosporothrix sp. COM3]
MQLENRLLDQRYRITQEIGKGGMGAVYRARDIRHQRLVAIKVIALDASNSFSAEQLRRDLKREIDIIAHLTHTLIVPLYDSGTIEDQEPGLAAYFVMPYYQAGSLHDWLHRPGQPLPLSTSAVIFFINQAADALSYVHQNAIVHCDVKPSNFLLDTQSATGLPYLHLADFGIARILTTTTSTKHEGVGSPPYMAPEQIKGKPVFASDQYALAVMAYEMLTGKPPFQGTDEQILYQHLHRSPRPASELNKRLSQAVDTVLGKALAKDPEERFGSVLRFAQTLEKALISPRTYTDETIIQKFVPPPQQKPPSQQAQKQPEKQPPTRVEPQRKRGCHPILLILALCMLAPVGFLCLLLQAHFSGLQHKSPQKREQTTTSPFLQQVQGTPTVFPFEQNSPAFQWELTSDQAGSCMMQDHAYAVSQKQQNLFTTCIATASDFQNFGYSAEVTIVEGDTAGILFHAQGASLFYVFQIELSGRYRLIRYTENRRQGAQILAEGSSAAIHTKPNEANTLGIIVRDTTIQLYVNGQLLKQSSIAAEHGQIGTFVDALNQPTTALFRNVRLWKL